MAVAVDDGGKLTGAAKGGNLLAGDLAALRHELRTGAHGWTFLNEFMGFGGRWSALGARRTTTVTDGRLCRRASNRSTGVCGQARDDLAWSRRLSLRLGARGSPD